MRLPTSSPRRLIGAAAIACAALVPAAALAGISSPAAQAGQAAAPARAGRPVLAFVANHRPTATRSLLKEHILLLRLPRRCHRLMGLGSPDGNAWETGDLRSSLMYARVRFR
jgi:hypothetical protein